MSSETSPAANRPCDDQHQGQEGLSPEEPGVSLAYHCLDQLLISNRNIQEAPPKSEGTSYSFCARRQIWFDGHYLRTEIDIHSEILVEALVEVMDPHWKQKEGEVPWAISEEAFRHLEELRKYSRKLAHDDDKEDTSVVEKKRERDREKKRHVDLFVEYLDEEFAETKQRLYPMMEEGIISFDLIWTMWRPGRLVYTTAFGLQHQPRVCEAVGMVQGDDELFMVGKFFDFDGIETFGLELTVMRIKKFEGTKKVTDLPVFPLEYHENEAQVRRDLIERGKKYARVISRARKIKAHKDSVLPLAGFPERKDEVDWNCQHLVEVDDNNDDETVKKLQWAREQMWRDPSVTEKLESPRTSTRNVGSGLKSTAPSEEEEERRWQDKPRDEDCVMVKPIIYGSNLWKDSTEVGDEADPFWAKVRKRFTDDEYLVASPFIRADDAEGNATAVLVSGIVESDWKDEATDMV